MPTSKYTPDCILPKSPPLAAAKLVQDSNSFEEMANMVSYYAELFSALLFALSVVANGKENSSEEIIDGALDALRKDTQKRLEYFKTSLKASSDPNVSEDLTADIFSKLQDLLNDPD